MHNVYDVAIVRDIIPAFDFLSTEIDVGSAISLNINAINSTFAAPALNGGDGRLSFKWECGDAL